MTKKADEKGKSQPIDLENAVSELELYLPIEEVSTFRDFKIKPEILKGLDKCGYVYPSLVQSLVIKGALEEKSLCNMIVQSQSGTGKTVAFGVIALQHIDPTLKQTQAIIFCHTHELSRQVYEVFCALSSFMGISVGLYVPKTDAERAELKPEPEITIRHVIIGTPGTLLRTRFHTQYIRCIVVDEADSLLQSSGQGDSVIRTLKNCVHVPLLLFSATYDDITRKFFEDLRQGQKTLTFLFSSISEAQLDRIYHYYYVTDDNVKRVGAIASLFQGLGDFGKAIIFCNRKVICNDLFEALTALGFSVTLLHSDVENREEMYVQFCKKDSRILVTTDVFSRGIDIPEVQVVVNFDIPTLHKDRKKVDVETFTHRIGRTARFGKLGIEVSFCTLQDKVLIHSLKNQLKKEFVELTEDELSFFQDTIQMVRKESEKMELKLKEMQSEIKNASEHPEKK